MIHSKLLFPLVVTSVMSANAFALEAKFADTAWDGNQIPAGQQCQKFGGQNPSTPALVVSDIPAGANAIVLEYSDRDSKKMDNGGHGRMQFMFNGSEREVTIPSVAGHSFDLPEGFKSIEAHRSPGWDKAGAYMPPCSGGKGHAYYVTVKAMQDDKVTATTVLEMGKY
ncbi:hypothetical protein Q4508_13210 [Amphritea sp. 2_MG-2023]|uniref:hypothetical protein n=1 Tax=Amphritea TaxID=515417 RepID=UPI001C073D6E|nr:MULTISPECIES: hypothetical protein [Amphritea]MBU2964232.1 hypothetical protein [Amphritea atlantica]MDO6419511.1 hypothetical protein [Amphritea sp. 2_MG-2023]